MFIFTATSHSFDSTAEQTSTPVRSAKLAMTEVLRTLRHRHQIRATARPLKQTIPETVPLNKNTWIEQPLTTSSPGW